MEWQYLASMARQDGSSRHSTSAGAPLHSMPLARQQQSDRGESSLRRCDSCWVAIAQMQTPLGRGCGSSRCSDNDCESAEHSSSCGEDAAVTQGCPGSSDDEQCVAEDEAQTRVTASHAAFHQLVAHSTARRPEKERAQHPSFLEWRSEYLSNESLRRAFFGCGHKCTNLQSDGKQCHVNLWGDAQSGLDELRSHRESLTFSLACSLT